MVKYRGKRDRTYDASQIEQTSGVHQAKTTGKTADFKTPELQKTSKLFEYSRTLRNCMKLL